MEIKYVFIYKIQNNSLMIKYPEKKKTKKIEKVILETFLKKKKEFEKKKRNSRIEILFGEENKLYLLKKNDSLIFGLITTKMRSKANIYKFLDNFYICYQNEDLKKIKQWLKIKKKDFEKNISSTKSLNIKLRRATQKIDAQIFRNLEINHQILKIDEKIIQTKKIAKENLVLADSIKKEAWWYNHKLQFFIYGGVGLVFIVFFVFGLGIFLK